MRFPKVITHRKAEATIYGKKDGYRFYRVAYRVDGQRRLKSFKTYADAKTYAKRKVREISKGSKLAVLTSGQASDAILALERLHRFYLETGRQVSLSGAVSEFCEGSGKLDGHTLAEAVDGFLKTAATVRRFDVGQAAERFIEERRQKTVAKGDKRPQLSPEHHYNTAIWLREFAKTFPGHCVCDLTKDFLSTYMAKHSTAAPKTRNERRGVVKQFLRWCVEQDFLSPTNRLLEATALKHETADPETIELYSAAELKSVLDGADKDLLPVLALAGLAGMRLKEIMRLSWEDVFRVPDHIEVNAYKSKTRSRRLIQICPALAAWLRPYQGRTGVLWQKSYDMFHEDFRELRESLKIPDRRNGLRHGFVSAHFAAHSDEGLTAAQAGNSPAIIHKNYKGLITKEEGEKWFHLFPRVRS